MSYKKNGQNLEKEKKDLKCMFLVFLPLVKHIVLQGVFILNYADPLTSRSLD